MTRVAYQHRQSAHCESGVVSGMLNHHGLAMSEPMAFGLASALNFAYIPIIKLGGMPLIAYRMPPRWIINTVGRRLGVRFVTRTFRDEEEGMDALDALLETGRIVGLQTSVYWLPYFPPEMRFHFNAHNLIVYGREGDDYLISDPVFEAPVRCPTRDLRKARFAKGVLAKRGLLYYPAKVPLTVDYERLVLRAIKSNDRIMCRAPLPLFGLRGIRCLAGSLTRTSQRRAGAKRLSLYLAHIVRMQEEVGTGGAGFRFVYASFLQEAARLMESAVLADAAAVLTSAGDRWREFALAATRASRHKGDMSVHELADLLRDCADREAAVWALLRRLPGELRGVRDGEQA